MKIDWAVLDFLIESNAIEREYGLQALSDSIDAWIFIMGLQELTYSDIVRVHRILMRNIDPDIAGQIRDHEVTVGGLPVFPAKDVKNNLEKWLKKYTRDKMTLPKDHSRKAPKYWADQQVIGAKIVKAHVDFERIHPFPDGNGRTGRIIYNWHRKRAKLPIHIIHEGAEQQEYYKWFLTK